MSSENGVFPVFSLRDAGVRLYDCEHKTPAASSSGYPYIAIPDIRDGRLNLANARRITERDYREWTRRTKPQAGDVLVTRRGRVGDTAVVPEGLECAIGQNLVILRSEGELVDQGFLRWALRSPLYRQQVEKYLNVGAVFSSLNCRHIPLFELPIPPLKEQRRIAGILGALDDKIEHNHLVCRRLDATSRLLGGHLLNRARQEDWPVGPIHEHVSIFGGATPSTKEPTFWGGAYRFVTPKDLAGLEFPVLLTTERTITKKGVAKVSSGQLPAGTLLLSSRAPIGYLAIAEVPVTVNQGFIAMICDRRLSAHFVLQWARRNHDVIVASANGTTFLEISKRAFRPQLIPIPPEQELRRFDAVAGPVHRQLVTLLRESETLVAIRDTLLPKLVSGAIRVPESYDTDDALGTATEAAGVPAP